MQWLEERGTGFATSQTVVPHVAGAILYDLGVGDPGRGPIARWGMRRPRPRARGPMAEGNVGVGTGATVGKLQGCGVRDAREGSAARRRRSATSPWAPSSP